MSAERYFVSLRRGFAAGWMTAASLAVLAIGFGWIAPAQLKAAPAGRPDRFIGLGLSVRAELLPGQGAASMEQLYEAALRSYAAGAKEYEEAAAAVVARGPEAVTFLIARLRGQAERVSSVEELKSSGILVTINLLGRMNSYPEARAALGGLRDHPVEKVKQWANYALKLAPQTQPAERPKTTGPTEAEPTTRRVEGDRILTAEGWFAKPKVNPPKLPETITRAFVIPIREPITGKTYDAIGRKAVRCRAAGAELIVFEMDTWGGEVGAALDIARLFKTDLKDIYKVCYVNTRAVSAGALIGLACDEIIATPTAQFGDCAPLLMMGKLEGVEREKIETVLRNEFRSSAEKNGYSVALAESMVSIQREVWLIRNDSNLYQGKPELQYVLAKDWRGRVRVPPGVTTAPSDPASAWELVRVVVPAGELPTLSSREAYEYGFASHVIDAPREEPLSALKEHFKITGELTVLEDNWSERLVELLTHPAVFGFLFFVALLCAYVEINTPGFGIPGAVAIVCFAVIFGSRFLTGMANWWEISLFLIGVVLLLVEIFVTPGFGVLGTLGIICCVAGLLAMVVPNAPDRLPWPQGPLDWSVFKNGLLALTLGFLAAIAASIAVARYLPQVPVAGKLVLAPPKLTAAPPVGEGAAILRVRPGQVGKVVQVCRPVGKIQVGDQLVDAVADGAFLAAGTEVVVLRNEGNRVVVQEKTG